MIHISYSKFPFLISRNKMYCSLNRFDLKTSVCLITIWDFVKSISTPHWGTEVSGTGSVTWLAPDQGDRVWLEEAGEEGVGPVSNMGSILSESSHEKPDPAPSPDSVHDVRHGLKYFELNVTKHYQQLVLNLQLSVPIL